MDRINDYEVNSPRWLSLDDFDGEIWRKIDICDNYSVSNYGRIKSHERMIKSKGNSKRLLKECILRVRMYFGYTKVSLSIKNKKMLVSVHRIVATAFIANPKNFPVVNHKNEIRHDNRAINLEWCTQKYNVNYGTGRSRYSMTIIERYGKPICQYNKDGTIFAHHTSITTAARQTGFVSSQIWRALVGKSITYKGYVWRYEGEPFDKYRLKRDYSQEHHPHGKAIVKYSLSGELLKVYDGGSREVEKDYPSISGIRGCLYGKNKTAYGYIWRYLGEEPPQAIPQKRKIVQYSLDYEYIAIYDSLSEAALAVKSKHETPISNCLHGRAMTALGYIWKFEDEGKPKFHEIEKLTMKGEHVETYTSIGEVLRAVGSRKLSTVSQCINGKAGSAYGYKWRYVNE